MSCSSWTIEYSFETLCRLLARAARSASDVKILTRGREEESGSVIVDEEADDDTDVETRTDMGTRNQKARTSSTLD